MAGPIPFAHISELQSLAEYLDKISATIASSFRVPEWVAAEITRLEVKPKYVAIHLMGLKRSGEEVKCKAFLWIEEWNRLAVKFLRDTGYELAPGHKILFLTRAEFHPSFGVRLRPVDIDPRFTLGDAEKRNRDALARLRQEGIVDSNRRLVEPFDIFRVIVISPAGAQGLGDFQKKVEQSIIHQLFTVDYIDAQFQGPNAETQIVNAFRDIQTRLQRGINYSAVAILRGGGSTSDFVSLNTYAIGRAICSCSVPVIVGVGDERDRCLMDDVAFRSASTPSLAAAYLVDLVIARASAWEKYLQICWTELTRA